MTVYFNGIKYILISIPESMHTDRYFKNINKNIHARFLTSFLCTMFKDSQVNVFLTDEKMIYRFLHIWRGTQYGNISNLTRITKRRK